MRFIKVNFDLNGDKKIDVTINYYNELFINYCKIKYSITPLTTDPIIPIIN